MLSNRDWAEIKSKVMLKGLVESCLPFRECFEGFKLCHFFFRFLQDHARSNLIWNFKTREELRDTLESEMRAFNIDRELGSANVISWNHQEFEVSYPL